MASQNINREIWTIKMNGFSEFNREKNNYNNRQNSTTMTATILTTTSGSSSSKNQQRWDRVRCAKITNTKKTECLWCTKGEPRQGEREREKLKPKTESELVKWLSEKLKNIFVGVHSIFQPSIVWACVRVSHHCRFSGNYGNILFLMVKHKMCVCDFHSLKKREKMTKKNRAKKDKFLLLMMFLPSLLPLYAVNFLVYILCSLPFMSFHSCVRISTNLYCAQAA